MKVWREFRFEAAHRLPHVAIDHKCSRMHGHSYRVELHVEGALRPDGMLVDFEDIKAWWQPLANVLDHRCLNDLPGLDNPTSENLARWIWDALDFNGTPVSKVVVRETATTGAEYP